MWVHKSTGGGEAAVPGEDIQHAAVVVWGTALLGATGHLVVIELKWELEALGTVVESVHSQDDYKEEAEKIAADVQLVPYDEGPGIL